MKIRTSIILNSALLIIFAGCVSAPDAIDVSRIGACSWSYQKPLREVADLMAESNVKGIHLALGPFIAPDGRHGNAEGEETWKFVKEQVASGKWNVMCTMFSTVGEDYSTLETIKKTGGIVPDATWEQNQKIVTRAAQLTQELGCKYLSGHAGFLDESNPAAFAKFITRVRWMRDECAKYGVTLILESGQESAEDLAKFMCAVPGVGINFDPANMILYNKGRPVEAVKTLYPWIKQVHAKDALFTKQVGTWGEEVPWGEGQVQAKELILILERLGYDGNYVIEREGGSSRVEDISKAASRLQK